MKTGKSILVGTGAVILGLIVAGMLVLRKDLLLTFGDKSYSNFSDVEMEPFDKLEITGPWHVEVMQGRAQEVKVPGSMIQNGSKFWRSQAGSLYLESPTLDNSANDSLMIKIVVPALIKVRAGPGARVILDGLQGDSIAFDLSDRSSLNWMNSEFGHISFSTSGLVNIAITDDPMK